MKERMSFINENNSEQNLIFKEGEVFDAQRELINLKNYHGEEGIKKVQEFKEKLRFQKLGLASMITNLLKALEGNENLRKDELLSMLELDIKKFALNRDQILALENSVDNFIYKNNNIKEVTDSCRDEEGNIMADKLYEQIFGKLPEGEMKVITNSYSIYFQPSDNRDYCYVVSEAYKTNRELTDEDMLDARTSAGAKLDNYPDENLNELIAIQNAKLLNRPEISKYIMTHERRHVVNSTLAKFFTMPDNDEVYRKYLELQKNGDIKGIDDDKLFISFERQNLDIKKRIKDEICAYFYSGDRSKYVSKMLLREDTIYGYGFNYNQGELDEDFDLEYLNMVENGIMVFQDFINKGYKIEEVVNLLLPEPLEKWPKVLQRTLGSNINSKEWQKKKERYINQEILKRDIGLKEDD
ncbi:MAG: hypothetical protein JJE53_01825 [Candidatus Pacebacteria bacterium]|nr:hypothetical protein [Candidatus Paceibacterota bacterium]